jgi:hypothetical protein
LPVFLLALPEVEILVVLILILAPELVVPPTIGDPIIKA